MRELERITESTDPDQPTGGAPLPALAVIGDGRAGNAVARAAREAGIEVRLAGREDALEAAQQAEIALLSVPDSEIVAACEAIAAAVPPIRLVGHTSGAATLNLLAPAVTEGAGAFSIHPLQTIPDGETSLAGAPCAVAGSNPAALGAAIELAGQLRMHPFEVAESDRAAYHAAAAMASNFLITLEELAAGVLTSIGAENARELLAPLVVRTAENWAQRGAAALTGPIARGDETTVDGHIAALRELDPELTELYEELAKRTRAIAAGEMEVSA